MKSRSAFALATLLACSAWLGACSSSKGGGTNPTDGGAGATSTGGNTNTGGSSAGGIGGSGGAKGGTGGATGGSSGSGGLDASKGGSAGGGARDSGTDGGGGAKNPLQGLDPYPAVPYTTENPNDPPNVRNAVLGTPAFDTSKALLGKILFWDEQIGQLNDMACGTCHRGEAGGSDPRATTAPAHLPGFDGVLEASPGIHSDDLHVAIGMPKCDINGVIANPGAPRQTTGRKPPTYLDAMFASQVFWDGRAGFCKTGIGTGCFYDPDLPPAAAPLISEETDPLTGRTVGGALEAQAIGPPVNPAEMACAGRTWAAIAAKLVGVMPLAKAQPGTIPPDMKQFVADHHNNYPEMFAAVYGSTAKVTPSTDPDNVINTRRIVFAITTHERRLNSNQTPWDKWNAGDDSAMTPAQVAGFQAFMGKARCNQCHAPPLFTDLSFHFIGFHEPQWDLGRQAITNDPNDAGRMKTAMLRNVGLREAGGLLHSGAGPGASLDTVMELYRSGGWRNNDAGIIQHLDTAILPLVSLTDTDVANLIDFMRNALTDPRVKGELPPFDRPKLGTEP